MLSKICRVLFLVYRVPLVKPDFLLLALRFPPLQEFGATCLGKHVHDLSDADPL